MAVFCSEIKWHGAAQTYTVSISPLVWGCIHSTCQNSANFQVVGLVWESIAWFGPRPCQGLLKQFNIPDNEHKPSLRKVP